MSCDATSKPCGAATGRPTSGSSPTLGPAAAGRGQPWGRCRGPGRGLGRGGGAGAAGGWPRGGRGPCARPRPPRPGPGRPASATRSPLRSAGPSLWLPDHWIWDCWFATDGEDVHVFFLQAPRDLGSRTYATAMPPPGTCGTGRRCRPRSARARLAPSTTWPAGPGASWKPAAARTHQRLLAHQDRQRQAASKGPDRGRLDRQHGERDRER
jgi:hypothetical protein